MNELWAYGNGLRKAKGLNELGMSDYLRSPSTVEFLLAVEKRYGAMGLAKSGESPDYPKSNLTIDYNRKTGLAKIAGGELSILKTKRGKYGGTWCHLQVLVHAAGKLDADFMVEIIDVFINNKILEWRDISGDEFKALNKTIDSHLPGREGKKSNTGIYINIAKMLNLKILGEKGNWNDASSDQLNLRGNLEGKLISYLEMGFIKDWEHLKEVINKL